MGEAVARLAVVRPCLWQRIFSFVLGGILSRGESRVQGITLYGIQYVNCTGCGGTIGTVLILRGFEGSLLGVPGSGVNLALR